jgi:cytochrome d ubiquinol oxidase subunit II
MTLPDLWFLLIALFFTGYFVLDGFDFGVGMSLPFLGRDDTDRRVLINTIGPVWDLNETWVIVAGACLFAAFPEWYATVFSGFYLPMLFILLALILRGVSFEYRHQRPGHRWKRAFDRMIFVGSVVPAFV